MISLWKLFLKNKRKPIRIRKKSKKGKEIAKMKRSHQASIGDKRFQTSIVSLSLSFVDIQHIRNTYSIGYRERLEVIVQPR